LSRKKLSNCILIGLPVLLAVTLLNWARYGKLDEAGSAASSWYCR